MIYFLLLIPFLVLSYFFLRPYKKRFNWIRLFLIFFPICVALYWGLVFFESYNKPKSFTKAIELLQKNKHILNKIGDYESYSYYDYNLPKKEDNPANIKASLKGSKAEIYLSCKIKKDASGNWNLIAIHQDSLVVK